ncbi:MAG: hypothetical protein NDP13_03230 [Crenarchaeota archaeon]|nr:hypothetical protein [Thermoproteota archaeon]MCR8453981.1 hypothetical protein [Thermoproteota archaeon]MCR8455194.1 hypothetical protein [Thermoproteota archaeon]MCR8463300.1 hypothetical protein [Thermoproteota archaeon]MCR8471048.1 hypothetical protein [Thermoproteota archaeon]
MKAQKPKEEELTIYKTRIKTIAKEKGFRVSGEFIIAFDKAVRELLEKAIKRAEMEQRKTLLPRHV